MIEQKDIDRLLAGRKIVDDCRAVAKTYHDAITTAKVDATAVATVKSRYQDRELAIKKMNEELAKIGFASQDDFFKFNQQMVLEEYREMVDISFLGCKGCPTKKCIDLYGDNACGNKAVSGIEDSMRLFFISLIKKSADGKEGNFADVKICPDGYGFHWKRNRDERFDLRWS